MIIHNTGQRHCHNCHIQILNCNVNKFLTVIFYNVQYNIVTIVHLLLEKKFFLDDLGKENVLRVRTIYFNIFFIFFPLYAINDQRRSDILQGQAIFIRVKQNKIGHSSRSSSIHWSKTTEVSGNNFEKFCFPSIEIRWTKDKETDGKKEKKGKKDYKKKR